MKVSISKELKELIPIFLSETEKTIKQLEEVIQKKDHERIKFYTHKLKGSFGNYGFNELSTLIKSLEIKAKENDSIENIKKELNSIIEYLNNIEIEYK